MIRNVGTKNTAFRQAQTSRMSRTTGAARRAVKVNPGMFRTRIVPSPVPALPYRKSEENGLADLAGPQTGSRPRNAGRYFLPPPLSHPSSRKRGPAGRLGPFFCDLGSAGYSSLMSFLNFSFPSLISKAFVFSSQVVKVSFRFAWSRIFLKFSLLVS